MKNKLEHRIGIISDTHGLIRPEAIAALRGVEISAKLIELSSNWKQKIWQVVYPQITQIVFIESV